MKKSFKIPESIVPTNSSHFFPFAKIMLHSFNKLTCKEIEPNSLVNVDCSFRQIDLDDFQKILPDIEPLWKHKEQKKPGLIDRQMDREAFLNTVNKISEKIEVDVQARMFNVRYRAKDARENFNFSIASFEPAEN